MKVIGGLSLDGDDWVFSFVSLRKRRLTPYMNIYGKAARPYDDLRGFITENIDDINKRVSRVERKDSFRTESIFFELPKEYAEKKETEDVISLNVSKEEKKVTYRDISFAKKQIENIVLDLKDVCLHHLVLEYRIGEQTFNRAPIGLWARKISLKSFIVFIPSDLYDTFKETFSNMSRKFSGFIYETLADYSVMRGKIADRLSFIMNIKKTSTTVSCFSENRIIFERTYGFGDKSIISYVARRLSFSEELTSDLVFKYSSFYDVSFSKEISVKDKNTYVNVSVSALNNLVKEAIKDKVDVIIADISKEEPDKDYVISFMGKIIQRDGFYDFIKKTFDINIEQPLYKESLFGAFGCVHYGITEFFEDRRRDSLWRRVIIFYKGYF